MAARPLPWPGRAAGRRYDSAENIFVVYAWRVVVLMVTSLLGGLRELRFGG
jgi:hypothetical protein